MRIKGKLALGAASTGLIGIATIVSTILAAQNEEIMGLQDSIDFDGQDSDSAIITASSYSRRRPGRVGGRGLRDSGEVGENIMKSFRKIKASEECSNRGGEWNSGECIIPEEIYKDINLDVRLDEDNNFSRLNKEECYGRGGYHMVTSKNDTNGTCMWPGILVKKDFEREIVDWEKVEAKAPKETQRSLSHFFSEGFMEIRREKKQYAVLFPEEKLTGKLAEWKFPGHLQEESYGAAINDICTWAKDSMENNWTTSFLYNGKTGRGWDCIGNKEIIFYTEEEKEGE